MQLSTAALELGAIKMTIPERGTILLSQAIAGCTLLMPPSIKSSTCVTSSAAIYGSGGLINIGDFILYKSANSSSVRLCVVCVGDTVCCLNVCWFCVFVCVILCMCLHSRKLVYSGEVSELVKAPTVLSSFLNQKQLFHKAVYLMSLTAHCSQWWTSSMSFLHLLSAQLCQWSTSALRPAHLLRRLHQLWLKGVIHPSTDLCLYMIGLILCTVTTSIA